MAKPRVSAGADRSAQSALSRKSRLPASRSERTLPQFDRLIHERIRLGIISALAVNDSLTFADLKRVLQTSDGNISVHARKLEEADYIRCTKSFAGRVPRTEYTLTAQGRRAFEQYLEEMETFVAQARGQ
ncbi:MAG TPA: transcriptional regulator [Candidatus Angelobacter sp.]